MLHLPRAATTSPRRTSGVAEDLPAALAVPLVQRSAHAGAWGTTLYVSPGATADGMGNVMV